MKKLSLVAIFLGTFCFAQSPSEKNEKDVIKSLIYELDQHNSQVKDCEVIIKNNCAGCHLGFDKFSTIKLFDDKENVLFKQNKDTLIKFFDGKLKTSTKECKDLNIKDKAKIENFLIKNKF